MMDRWDEFLQEEEQKMDNDEIHYWVKLVGKIAAAVTVAVIAIVITFKVIGPQLNLYRANTEKKAAIAEARAESEAAEFKALSRVTQAKAEADAEVERARGLAAAQEIITATLTPEYLRYLYIQSLDVAGAEVIYIPTEAGLPVLEANRLPATPPAPEDEG